VAGVELPEMPTARRVIAGFVFAPLVVTPFSAVSTWLTAGQSVGQYVIPHAMLALMLSYVGTTVLGIPAFLVMQRQRWLRFIHIVGASVMLGLVFPTLLNVLSGVNWFAFSGNSARFATVLYGTCVGYAAAIGIVFWSIAIRPTRPHESRSAF
jgi:hypothetical protein